MVYIQESQTKKYPRVKDQFLSTNAHFHDHPHTREFPYCQSMSKTSTSGLLYNGAAFFTSTQNQPNAGRMAANQAGHAAAGTNVKLFESSLDSTAAGSGLNTTSHGFQRSHNSGRPALEASVLNSMGMPGYMYKANGSFELTSKRLDLPRPRSGHFTTTDMITRKSEYSANYTNKNSKFGGAMFASARF